jgi:spore coat protein U-like protein
LGRRLDRQRDHWNGTGSDDARTVYARIPAGQNAATLGSYSDTVTVTVTY